MVLGERNRSHGVVIGFEELMENKHPLHVLIVFHASFPEIKGGINKMIATLADAWSEKGHQVSILSPGNWEDRYWSSRYYGAVAVHRQRMRTPWDAQKPLRGFLGWLWEFPQVFLRLWRFVKDEKVDIIHLHTPREYQYWIRLLSLVGGPPYVLTFHGTDALHFSTGRAKNMWLLKWIAKGARGRTAVAYHYATLIEQHHPGLIPVRTIPNGIAVASATADGECHEEVCAVHLPGCFFIQVGWVEPPKGQDVAIRAWGALKKLHPDCHLLIIGDEPFLRPGEPYYPGYRQQMTAMMTELGVQETVHLTGAIEPVTLQAIMKKARGLVFPSHREGMPYVLLEAGLLGLPVVCSDIPAFQELIDHGYTGYLVPQGDHEAWALAVARLLRDETMARTMGANLQRMIIRYHDAAVMAERYTDLFSDLLCAL